MHPHESSGHPSTSQPPSLTSALNQWIRRDGRSEAEIYALVYDELHRLASAQLRRERADPLLQTTALVNDAFLRLTRYDRIQWENREHFFAFSGRVMRQVLVDYARQRQSERRGGLTVVVPLDRAAGDALAGPPAAEQSQDVLAVHDALSELETFDPSAAVIVELRFFAGLSVAEVAKIFGRSEASVHRRWRVARAWLYDTLRSQVHGS